MFFCLGLASTTNEFQNLSAYPFIMCSIINFGGHDFNLKKPQLMEFAAIALRNEAICLRCYSTVHSTSCGAAHLYSYGLLTLVSY